MKNNLKIGKGGISRKLVSLSKLDFLNKITPLTRNLLFPRLTDEDIETILSDLWEASNPKTDGGNTSSKKTKSTATAVVGVDSTEPIGDGAVLDGAE